MFSCLPLGRKWILHAQQCAQSRGDMAGDFPPHNSVSKLGNRRLRGGGERNIQANKQEKREEGRGWSQSNQLLPPRAEEESQAGHTQKTTEDESPCEIHVFISVCKVFLFLWPYQHAHASSMSFSPFASSFPLFSLSLPPPSSSSSAPSVYVSFCP